MKLIFKSLLIFLFFVLSVLVFLPKENLYCLALEKLQNEKILINSKSIKDELLSLNINNSIIYYDGIQACKVSSVGINLYLFENSVNIYNIRLDDMMKQFLPPKIKSLNISHSLFNPLIININANLIQAKAYGSFDISTSTLTLYIKPSKHFVKSYKKLLLNMIKQENGEYKIEYKL
ncbi:MAG TPA: hypothetical protein EYG97_01010 [Arcobacter sp.]|nr:hypothetical protein [Arcobacter sp.]HIP55583.1 hypothetical protein [Arcobacter sp.]